MEKHQKECLEAFLERCKTDPTILAVLLGGSIAHGFARPKSDIDVMLVVSAEEYERRKEARQLAYSIWDLCTYEEGYVDCKFVDLNYMELVAKQGSDPARFAFKDARIVYSRLDQELEKLLESVSQFPDLEQGHRRRRFAAQLLAWRWYYEEGLKKGNLYLQTLAAQKLVLFGCRLVLNENRMLYPYHKWLMQVTRRAAEIPQGFFDLVDLVLDKQGQEHTRKFCSLLLDWVQVAEEELDWPNYFLHDSEQSWLYLQTPVDDC